MRTPERLIIKTPGVFVRSAFLSVIAVAGCSLIVISCNPAGPEITGMHEQVVFTAQDTLDIKTLATTLHAGTIREIAIVTVDRQTGGSASVGMCDLIPLTNHATVRFEPEFTGEKIKRYHSISVSNTTWPESEQLKKDPFRIVRNNWITSGDCLHWHDKTVLKLDSCTIEATVSGVDIDTAEHLLNLISASEYSIDTVNTAMESLKVSDVSSIQWSSEWETHNVLVICRESTVFQILYADGEVHIKKSGIILRLKRA